VYGGRLLVVAWEEEKRGRIATGGCAVEGGEGGMSEADGREKRAREDSKLEFWPACWKGIIDPSHTDVLNYSSLQSREP
jgi:hypothetical protein